MYITRLKLENIRCFEELEIDFEKLGSSILILGDNGDGKSTILKCLAMGLCDESSAAALFRELPGEFVRRQPGEEEVKIGAFGTIEIDITGDGDLTYCIVTKITSLKAFERVKQKLFVIQNGKRKQIKKEEKFPWEEIFVSGYGAGIRVHGSADFQHYLAVDAVYPLFRYDVPLQNPELVIRRLVEAAMGIRKDPKLKIQYAKRVLDTIKHLLAGFLDLQEDDQVVLTSTGIKVKGHWGIAELGELGDGYRSKITWVLDLLAWWFLKAERKARLKVTDIRGIVLIDEIEQHLHPRWQLTILPLLQKSFKGIQFIATSHSPLVASGSKSVAVHILKPRQHRIERPYGWLAEDVYCEVMGLSSSQPAEIEELIEKFESLYYKSLEGTISKNEKKELSETKYKIRRLGKQDIIILERKMGNLKKYLKKLQ